MISIFDKLYIAILMVSLETINIKNGKKDIDLGYLVELTSKSTAFVFSKGKYFLP